jgi:hypothetical protein
MRRVPELLGEWVRLSSVIWVCCLCLTTHLAGAYPSAAISQAAYDLILHHEVSSRAFYDEVYAKPTVPPEDSGVTIGIGYDLGQVSRDTFLADWSGVLSREDLQALSTCIGLRRGSARSALRRVKHIYIPFEDADRVFKTRSLPRAIKSTLDAFPGSDRLPGDAFGALVSLVYNRGSAVHDRPGSNRRIEMRQIRQMVATGRFAEIPNTIRQMKRIWSGRTARGLLRRREDEARLFERALGGQVSYLVAFDRDPGRGYTGGVGGRPTLPMRVNETIREIVPANEMEAEEIRAFFFHNAEMVANSLAERIEAIGGKNVCTLYTDSKDDMIWLTEFRGLVLEGKDGARVQTEKGGRKFVSVDITDLDFSEYPPAEVARILLLTQGLLKTKIPSPLLAKTQ